MEIRVLARQMAIFGVLPLELVGKLTQWLRAAMEETIKTLHTALSMEVWEE